MYKEVTDYDKWYNRHLLRVVEILQFTTEFADKQKPGQHDLSVAPDLIALLTLHEEDILKQLLKEVDWENTRQAHAYRFFDDPYHKLDADDHIRKPVHVPHMFSYTFLGLVTETTATEKEQEVYHTERAVWTSKRAREALLKRHKRLIENQEKPQ